MHARHAAFLYLSGGGARLQGARAGAGRREATGQRRDEARRTAAAKRARTIFSPSPSHCGGIHAQDRMRVSERADRRRQQEQRRELLQSAWRDVACALEALGTFEVRDDADTEKNVAFASVATCSSKCKHASTPDGYAAATSQQQARARMQRRRRCRTAFARSVFPVPGGPKSRSPLGGARSPCAERRYIAWYDQPSSLPRARRALAPGPICRHKRRRSRLSGLCHAARAQVEL